MAGIRKLTLERILLSVSKRVILFIMLIALLTVGGATLLASYLFVQMPRKPEAPRAVAVRQVGIDDFLRRIEPAPEVKPEKSQPAKIAQPQAPVAKKYLDEARRIISCTENLSLATGNKVSQSDDAIEAFREFLERSANLKPSRGQGYASDAVRVVCSILQNDQVLDLKKKNPELKILIPAIEYHAEGWDKINEETKNFVSSEERRVLAEEMKEERRVQAARTLGWQALMAAGAGLGLFTAVALYLILLAIESSLKQIGEGVDRIGQAHRPENSALRSGASER
jgi:hypothetical protein